MSEHVDSYNNAFLLSLGITVIRNLISSYQSEDFCWFQPGENVSTRRCMMYDVDCRIRKKYNLLSPVKRKGKHDKVDKEPRQRDTYMCMSLPTLRLHDEMGRANHALNALVGAAKRQAQDSQTPTSSWLSLAPKEHPMLFHFAAEGQHPHGEGNSWPSHH